MKTAEEYTYYCLFDPTTGKRLGGYVEGVHKIPVDAIKVSYNDFMLYASSANWHYDWDKKEPIFIPPAAQVTLKEMKDMALAKINKSIEAEIVSPLTINVPRLGAITLDCDRDTQLNIFMQRSRAADDPDKTWPVRCTLEGEYVKTMHDVTFEGINRIAIAIENRVSNARVRGSKQKDYVNDPERTVEEIRAFLSTL